MELVDDVVVGVGLMIKKSKIILIHLPLDCLEVYLLALSHPPQQSFPPGAPFFFIFQRLPAHNREYILPYA